jgi:hypothetical protein
LVELYIFDNFESKSKIAEQYVYAQEPNETEIAQHVIERQRAIIAHDFPEGRSNTITRGGDALVISDLRDLSF